MWLVDFNARKNQLFLSDWSNNTGVVDVKMDVSVLEEESSLKMLVSTFSSKLDWDSCNISIAKTNSKKVAALICSMKFLLWFPLKFLSPEVALYLYKSTLKPYMKYCCYVWAGAPSCYLALIDKLQKHVFRTVALHLLPLLNPWLIIEM